MQERVSELQEWMGDDPFNIERLHPHLRPWVDDSGSFLMLKHPLVYSVAPIHQMVNRAYEVKYGQLRQAFRDKDWRQLLWLYERPYRMPRLTWLWDHGKLSLPELRDLLASFWIDCEMPEANQDDPLELFRAAGFTLDNEEAWSKLPDEFTVYRGVDWHWELTETGPSWTLDYGIARHFAYRLGGDEREGAVFSYPCRKDEILAYLTGRGEEEVILDFTNESDLERIEEIERAVGGRIPPKKGEET